MRTLENGCRGGGQKPLKRAGPHQDANVTIIVRQTDFPVEFFLATRIDYSIFVVAGQNRHRDVTFDLAGYQQFARPDRCMGEIDGKVEPFPKQTRTHNNMRWYL